ncbi:MAG: prolipoprotein diacylglyceryl transferase [Anaerolineae bacterium]|jgi:phosphatidylglycerol---prolipoprotein diacylglyceryl transferase
MYPTLFSIGNWSLSTYTVLLDLGLILGLALTYVEGRRRHAGPRLLDLALWVVIGGVAAGRVGYVVANWSAFSEDWLRAFYVWEGGLSFHGAFLGGLLVLALFSALGNEEEESLSFGALADLLTPGLALGLVFGWAACLMAACAYGATGEGFGYALLPDIYGVEASRFATQAFALGFALLLFVGAWLLRGRWPFEGAGFLTYTLLYFAGHFFLEFTRGDEAIYLGPWRLAQLIDVLLVLAAAGGLLFLWRRAALAPAEGLPAAEEPPEPEETAAEEPPAEENAKSDLTEEEPAPGELPEELAG